MHFWKYSAFSHFFAEPCWNLTMLKPKNQRLRTAPLKKLTDLLSSTAVLYCFSWSCFVIKKHEWWRVEIRKCLYFNYGLANFFHYFNLRHKKIALWTSDILIICMNKNTNFLILFIFRRWCFLKITSLQRFVGEN